MTMKDEIHRLRLENRKLYLTLKELCRAVKDPLKTLKAEILITELDKERKERKNVSNITPRSKGGDTGRTRRASVSKTDGESA
jgi:hypothetical protein